MVNKRVIIIGAAGRDFHNFNVYFRNNSNYEVVAFTANQIPDIEGRIYPSELAGVLYPKGIPVYSQQELPELIKKLKVDTCVFSYSDISNQEVMSVGAIVNASGAELLLLGPKQTMLSSTKPVISVCATRTGAGKSQTSRKIVEWLMKKGKKVVAVRHPMPYGDLVAQKVQRFASIDDLTKHRCTIEEMEEYEPHISRGNVIYAGVDYEAILKAAENDPDGCDIVLWDGGNNDFSFYKPDLSVVITDPHRVGSELTYYPSEVVMRTADIVIINKIDSANPEDIIQLRKNISSVNPKALVIDAASAIKVDSSKVITGKRVLCVEDGPTLTHGEMKIGAAVIAAQKFGAVEIVDPRPFIVGKLARTFNRYPNIGKLLPAMGYGDEQVRDLEQTINNTDCDAVIIGTPIDLNRIINIEKPNTRVYYDLEEIGEPKLDDVLNEFLAKL
ncbi:MAG: cyclic 2,3-diphosphoglycerate synthase [Draconibacterium sp.]|nr:cyclic 2,3-diphosphoglycerate synthase [Draconibacterium sp.]